MRVLGNSASWLAQRLSDVRRVRVASPATSASLLLERFSETSERGSAWVVGRMGDGARWGRDSARSGAHGCADNGAERAETVIGTLDGARQWNGAHGGCWTARGAARGVVRSVKWTCARAVK